MTVSEASIQPGKRYRTRGEEKYKVISVTRGIVTYQTWTSPLRINVGARQFADAVYKEVRCPQTP